MLVQKKSNLLLFFCWVFLLMLPLSSHASLSVQEAYRSALSRNENVENEEEHVKIMEERYSQAKGALFPTINGVATYSRQETPSSSFASNLSPGDQKTYKITASQPLFRGFREWSALRQQKDMSEAAALKRDQGLVQLFADVADVYYQVILAEKDLQNLKRENDINDQRLKELRRFRSIGRIREGDVLNLQASLAILDAAIEGAQTALLNSRSALALMTGVDRNAVLSDQLVFPGALDSIDGYFSKIDTRPDIRALQKEVDAADEQISIARGGHFPSIDLLGNYYFQRPGFLKDVKWDVQLTLTFPIFQGGVVLSQTREAVSMQKQTELVLAHAKRQAREDIETLYQKVKSDLVQIQKQKIASDLSEKNYQAQVRDYRLGLVNNIEVLQVLTNSQQTVRNLNRAEYQFKTDYIRLRAATGAMP